MDAEIGKELEATVAARRELGEGHDDELIASFLDRIERRLDHHRPGGEPSPELVRAFDGRGVDPRVALRAFVEAS